MSAASHDRGNDHPHDEPRQKPPAGAAAVREGRVPAPSQDTPSAVTGDSPSARFAVAAIAMSLGAYALFEAQGMSRLGSVFPTGAGLVLVLGGLISAALGWHERRRRDTTAADDGSSDGMNVDATMAQRETFTASNAGTDAPHAEARPAGHDLQRIAWWRWIGVVVALLGWAWLLQSLGFLLASALGMGAIFAATWREPMTFGRAMGHLVVFAALLGTFYAIMRYVLRIALP